MKKKSRNSKKKINGTGLNKPVVATKATVVLFTLEGLRKIYHAALVQRMCYGDVTMEDTIAMEKILTALAKNESIAII